MFVLKYVNLNIIYHQKHHLTISFSFPPDQNFPRTQKTRKSSWYGLRGLAVIHHCQADQTETQNWCINHAALGGPKFIAKRFFFKNPKSTQERCVAWRQVITRHAISGKNPRNVNFIQFRQFKCTHSSYSSCNYTIHNKSTISSSLNLVSLA